MAINAQEIDERVVKAISLFVPSMEQEIDRLLIENYFESKKIAIRIDKLRRKIREDVIYRREISSQSVDPFLEYGTFAKFFRKVNLFEKVKQIYEPQGWQVKYKRGIGWFTVDRLIFSKRSASSMKMVNKVITRNDLLDFE